MIIAKTFAAGLVLAIAAVGFGAFPASNQYVIVDAGGCGAAALCP